MAKVKINITVDEELLRRVDEYIEDNFTNRSGAFSVAMSQFLMTSEVKKAVVNMGYAMRKIADTGSIDPESARQLDDFQRLAALITGGDV